MAQITNATIGTFPVVVVFNTWFKFRVTFDEDIVPATFDESAFVGDIEIKTGSKKVITADEVFEFVGRFPVDLEKGTIDLQLGGIDDAGGGDPAVAKVVKSGEIVVLERPTFIVTAALGSDFPVDFFVNPLYGNLALSL